MIPLAPPVQATFADLAGRQMDRADTNREALARVIGLPEQNLREFDTGRESSPRFDRLVQVRKRIPTAMLRDMVRALTEGTSAGVLVPDEEANA